jgi:hypothetical protein
VGPRAVLDAVVKTKIPRPLGELNPTTPIVQPTAHCYTDLMIIMGCAIGSRREVQCSQDPDTGYSPKPGEMNPQIPALFP